MLKVIYLQLAQSQHLGSVVSLVISIFSAIISLVSVFFAGYKVFSDRPMLKAKPFLGDNYDINFVWLDRLAKDIKIKVENVGNRIARVKKVKVYFKPIRPEMKLTAYKTGELFMEAGYLKSVENLTFDLLPKMTQEFTFSNSKRLSGGGVMEVFEVNGELPSFHHVLVIDLYYNFYRSAFYYAVIIDKESGLCLVKSKEAGPFKRSFPD